MIPPTDHQCNADTDVTTNGEINQCPGLKKILPSTLYLTLNAPQVDEYHRGLFLTSPTDPSSVPHTIGTLFHATYITPPPTDPLVGGPSPPPSAPSSPSSYWTLETRPVLNLSKSKNLVLLYRVCSLANPTHAKRMQEIFNSIPLGTSLRSGVTGNPKLGGYDCMVWTTDALAVLKREGLIESEESPEKIMARARSIAGPPDAREMVGKDFGGLRVINEDS